MHGSGGIDCQSAISIIPVIVQKVPEMTMIRLFSLSLCKSSLWSIKHKAIVKCTKILLISARLEHYTVSISLTSISESGLWLISLVVGSIITTCGIELLFKGSRNQQHENHHPASCQQCRSAQKERNRSA